MNPTTTPREAPPVAVASAAIGESLVDTFVRQGFVVLEDAVPPALLDELRRAYAAALDAKIRRFGVQRAARSDDGRSRVLNEFVPVGGNHDVNRWNMHLPSRHPFLDERIFAHPRVLELVEQLIGPDAVAYLMASDTAYPGSQPQSVHQDFTRFQLAANIPLIDFTPDNGPIELWPGTHLPVPGDPSSFTTAPYFIPADRMERIAREPGRPMIVRAGSILLRDHRLVHRGTANRTDAPRAMLSIYYAPPHRVPHRSLADLGARAALGVRKVARGGGDQVARPKLLNLGNLLGRVVEESSLSDRDYRRVIPTEIWQGLSSRARHLLRFARVEHSAADRLPAGGSLAGSADLVRDWSRSLWGFASSAISKTPRKPDHDSRGSSK